MTLERLAAAVAVLLVAALALAARDVVLAMSSNADFVSPLVIGRRAAAYPDALLVTGNYGWFNGLWVTQALSRLPGYSTLANYLPLVVTVLAALGLGAVAARVWGRLAGLVTLLVPLAVGSAALETLASFSARAPTWWTMVAVGLVAVWRARGPEGVERVAWVLTTVVVAIGAGATLAGDALAWAVVVAPLAAAAGVLAASRAWRPAAALGLLLASVVGLRFAIGALAGGAGYRFTGAPTPLTPLRTLEAGSANAVVGLQRMWRTTDGAGLDVVRGLLGLGLVLAAVAVAVTLLAAVAWRAPERGADPAGRARLTRRVWVAFWLVVVVASVGAFAVTTVSGPLGTPAIRYLLAVPFAAGALLGAGTALARGGRLLALPVVVLAAWAAIGVTVEPPRESPDRHRPAISAITAAVEAYDLDLGYASYWTAYPIEQATDYRYPMLPATPCRAGQPALCRPFLHYVSRAYEPRRGVRSFLLVDRSARAAAGDPLAYVTQRPPGPAPERTIDVGDDLTMLVYPFDLAGTLGPSGAVPERPS